MPRSEGAAMRTLRLPAFALALGLLATGCAGTANPDSAFVAGSVVAPDAVRDGTLHGAAPASSGGLIYVADTTDSNVSVYPLAGKYQKQIGEIPNVPLAAYMNVDTAHNLYVAEFFAGTVDVYARGAKKPSLVLGVEPSGARPNGVAVSAAGEVAVGQYDPVGIEFYRKGATKPFKTIAPPANFGAPGLCAYDASGNLYVIGSSGSPSHLGEIVGGGSGSSIEDFGTMPGIQNGRGVQVTSSGNVAVIADAGVVETFAPHSTKLLSKETLLDPPSDGPQPNGGLWFTPDGKDLYVASGILNIKSQGEALEYAYPKGGTIVNTIDVVVPKGGSQTAVTSMTIDP